MGIGMKRSINQALYKFLPGMWVSYKDENYDRAIEIQIQGWNYTPMKDIYGKFLEYKINTLIGNFERSGGDISSYKIGESGNTFYFVEPARLHPAPDVMGAVSPLLFYCEKCNRVSTYSNIHQVKKINWRCEHCKGILKQAQTVYACSCGYSSSIDIPVMGRGKELYYDPTQKFNTMHYYNDKSEIEIAITKKCPDCDRVLTITSAEQGSNYIPASISIINLLNDKFGSFYEKGEKAQKIVLAKWLNALSIDKYMEIVEKSELVFSKEMSEEYKNDEQMKNLKEMYEMGMLTKEKYDEAVQFYRAKKNEGSIEYYFGIADKALYDICKGADSKEILEDIAYNLMQYNTIKDSEKKITLDDIINNQKKMNFIFDDEEILELHKQMGIRDVQVSCDTEIINCTYGYTRKTAEPKSLFGQESDTKQKRLKLNSFGQNKYGTQTLVYSSKLVTEGLLFDIDMKKIVEWLIKNDYIKETEAPDIDDEVCLKEWFLENVNGSIISPFDSIPKNETITKAVYNLLHTMSHVLIKTAGELCGLSANSLSEIIFPENASIYIYAQTSQGIPLGAISGMAESKYYYFLRNALEDNKDCIFDPICNERDDTSCAACTQLAETTCCHFNKDLGRKFIYSFDDRDEIGFWEM